MIMEKLSAYQVTELSNHELQSLDAGGVYEWFLAGKEVGIAAAKAVKKWFK